MKILNWLILKQWQHRWKQYLVLSLSIFVASFLFTIGFALLWSADQPFDHLFNQLKGGHCLLRLNQQEQNASKIGDWFRKQPEVVAVSEARATVYQKGPFLINSNAIDAQLHLTEYSIGHDEIDLLYGADGKPLISPKRGEVWLPATFAKSQQILWGDSLVIPTPSGLWKLRVEALVIDAHYASGMINPGIAWVGAGTLAGAYPLERLQEVTLSIRFKHAAMLETVWNRFLTKHQFDGSKMDHHLFRAAFSAKFNLVAGILLLVSTLTFTIAILLIRSSLKANIAADFRDLGVLKSLGVTPNTLGWLYGLQVMLLAISNVVMAAIVCRLVFPLFLRISQQSVGLAGLHISTIPFLLSIAIGLLLIATITWHSCKSAIRVPAAAAIRLGRPVSRAKFHLLQFGRLTKVSLLFSALLTQSRPQRFLGMVLVVTSCITILSMMLNMYHSFSEVGHRPAAWGFVPAEITYQKSAHSLINRRHSELMPMLHQEEGVLRVVSYSWYTAHLVLNERFRSQSIMGKVFTTSLEEVGLLNLEGRHPDAANEVSFCIGTARQNDISIGAKVVMQIEGIDLPFEVTGIYQDIGNMGQGFRLHGSSMKRLNPLFEPEFYGLQLNDSAHFDSVTASISARYGNILELETSPIDRIEDLGILSGISSLNRMVGGFFLLLLLILLFLDHATLFREEYQNLSTLRALGVSMQQMHQALVARTFVIFIMGILLGILVGIGFGAYLISLITGGLGLVDFPYRVLLKHNLILASATFVIALFWSWIISHQALKAVYHSLASK